MKDYNKKYSYILKKIKNFKEDEILSFFDLYEKEKKIIKSININYEKIDNLEEFTELLKNKIIDEKTNNFIENKLTYKQKKIITNEIIDLIKIIIRKTNNTSLINDKIKNLRSFNDIKINLIDIIEKIDLFNKDKILDFCRKKNIDIEYNKNNIIVIKIDSYEKSKIIGDKNWCISKEKKSFEYYNNNTTFGVYYFIFDLNKKITNPLSYIACNINLKYEKDKIVLNIDSKFNKNNNPILNNNIHNNILMNLKTNINKLKEKQMELDEFIVNNQNLWIYIKNRKNILNIIKILNDYKMNELLNEFNRKKIKNKLFLKSIDKLYCNFFKRGKNA